MLRLRTVCLAAVALAAGGFFVGRMLVAQDKSEKGNRPGPRAGGGFGLSKLNLLKVADVQKDLELTDDQKSSIDKFTEEMQSKVRDEMKGIRDLPQDERRAKYAELRTKLADREKEVQAKLDEVLKTPQRDRLGQIELQADLKSNRLEVFEKKEIAEGLSITDEQKEKLKDLREKARADFREANGGQNGPPSEEAREKMKKLGEETMSKAKEILTSEQREKLEKMTGKKFEGDLGQLGRGFGRGGRRNRPGAGAPSDSTPAKPAEKTTEKTPEKTESSAPSK